MTESPYASWPRRAAAWIVDLFLATTAAFLVLIVASIPFHGHIHLEDGWGVVAFGAFAMVWEVLWLAGPPMGTPGQLLFGFRVATLNGARLTPTRAALRGVAKVGLFVMIGMNAPISAVLIAVTRRRQALHDVLVGTVAVRSYVPVGTQLSTDLLPPTDVARRFAAVLPPLGPGTSAIAPDTGPEPSAPIVREELQGPFL